MVKIAMTTAKNSSHVDLLREYTRKIELTDRLPQHDLRPVLMGLFGEVGSIMATAKKLHREQRAYAGYQYAVEEEFGDALWYFAALCRRIKFEIEEILSEAMVGENSGEASVKDHEIPNVTSLGGASLLDEALLRLGEATVALFVLASSKENAEALLRQFANDYARAVELAGVKIGLIIRKNTAKACGRFLDPDPLLLPNFDENFSEEESLPQHFEIKITQRKSGQSYLQWNGVFIGDPLTDNILEPDGYRFHDVFHLTHASILHWSPTFRSLIKHKRKSDQKVDEIQDGGRAIVVEEGLSAWIFARAKELNFFEGQSNISFDLLKSVHQFVQGYEVEACPLKLWEDAILQGYEVFRKVRDNNGGIVVGDRVARTIEYVHLSEM